jgi:hypothetical protein
VLEAKGQQRLYAYFETMMELISLFCLSRNFPSIRAVEKLYKLDMAVACFLNEKIAPKLRSNFAKVIIHAYVNRDPYEKQNVPNFARIWTTIVNPPRGGFELPREQLGRIRAPFLKLKESVVEYFTRLGGVSRSFDADANLLTLEVLNMVDVMLRQGFYQNENEVREMILPIINLLDGSNDFTEEAEEAAFLASQAAGVAAINETAVKTSRKKRYARSESNALVVKIKKKTIEILTQIMAL